jgi:hypothetical protein
MALEKKKGLSLIAVFALLFLAVAMFFNVSFGQSQTATQQQTLTDSLLFLSMPQEYLNYTITSVNGTLWAKINGVYPIHLSSGTGETLPMVYPTPPNTTNLHVKLDGTELAWGNYSDIDPVARHHTDIGDWQMIYTTVNPASADFLLEIHYEHPVEIINGSYTFLYDLNIAYYLSPSSPNSTAHFTIFLPTNASDPNIFTTGSNSQWTPVNFSSTKNASSETVTFSIVSGYGKPVLGDIAFVLRGSEVPEFSAYFATLLTAAVTFGCSFLC